MSLSDFKDLATVIGVAAAVGTLFKGLVEYRRSIILGRISHFAQLKQQFFDKHARITELIETDDPQLTTIPPREKWLYLCFFEEVALLHSANLIRDELAFYMFGYYAIRCANSQYFWNSSFPKQEDYWLLFFDFLAKMKCVQASKTRDCPAFVRSIKA